MLWIATTTNKLLFTIFIFIIKDASIHGQANVFSAHHQLTHHVRLCVLTLCLLKGLNCISLLRLYLLYHLSLNKLLLVHLNTSHSHLLLLLHTHWHSVIMLLVASNNYCILHILNNLLFLLLGLTCT